MKIKDEIERTFTLLNVSKPVGVFATLKGRLILFILKGYYQDKIKIWGEMIETLEEAISPKDVIIDPYVLEFLDLKQNNNLYEKDLETTL